MRPDRQCRHASLGQWRQARVTRPRRAGPASSHTLAVTHPRQSSPENRKGRRRRANFGAPAVCRYYSGRAPRRQNRRRAGNERSEGSASLTLLRPSTARGLFPTSVPYPPPPRPLHPFVRPSTPSAVSLLHRARGVPATGKESNERRGNRPQPCRRNLSLLEPLAYYWSFGPASASRLQRALQLTHCGDSGSGRLGRRARYISTPIHG